MSTAVLLVCLAPRANADDAVQTQVHVQATTAASIRQFRGAGFALVDQQAIAQRLSFFARDPDTRLDAFARATYRFDPALPRAPQDPRVAERQLEPDLDAAWVRYRPADAVSLQLGRITALTPFGAATIDGAMASFRQPRGPALDLALGARADSASARVNPAAFDPLAPLEQRRDPGARGVLGEARAQWNERAWSVGAGVRAEGSPGRARRYDRRAWVGARAGDTTRGHVAANLRYVGIQQIVDRADLVARLPTGESTSLDASARWTRPAFPLDSPFSVYATDPALRLRLGVRTRVTQAATVSAALATRHLPAPGALPVGGSGARRRVGADVGLMLDPASARWRSNLSLHVERGDDASAFTASSTAATSPRRGPAVSGTLRTAVLRDERDAFAPERAYAAASCGVHAVAGRRAAIDIVVDGGWDTFHRANAGLFVLLDVSLPGAP